MAQLRRTISGTSILKQKPFQLTEKAFFIVATLFKKREAVLTAPYEVSHQQKDIDSRQVKKGFLF